MKETNGTIDTIISRLMFEHKMRAMDLARALNIPQPTIHRIATGKSINPHPSTLEPIAQYFNITVDQLTGKAPIQDPNSWINALLPARAQIARQLPLVQWDALKDLNFTKPIFAQCHIVVEPDFPEDGFAVKMNDSSMYPDVREGEILLLSPSRKIKDRCNYLVKLAKNQQVILRQDRKSTRLNSSH